MTLKRLQFGEFSVAVDSLNLQGLLNGSQLPTSRPAAAPIQTRRWARNGKHPNAVLESMKSEAGNQAALFKTKEVFRSTGDFPTPFTSAGMTSGAGVCNRWRCAFHSGPFAAFVDVEVYLAMNTSFGTASSFGQVDITDVAAGTTQTATFPTGAGGTGSYFDQHQLVTQRIFLAPDRDYTVVFSDHGSDMLFANIAEFSSLTAYLGGYLPQNVAAGGPILAGYRQNVAELAKALWMRGGWPLGNWTIEDGTLPPTTSSTTPTNLFEATVDATPTTTLGSSTVSPSTMGWILDTRGHARRSQLSTGVPVVLALYGKSGGGAAAGEVTLVDPTGAPIIAGSSVFDNTGTAAWVWLSGVLPANKLQKYDLMFSHGAGSPSVSIYAASLYELG